MTDHESCACGREPCECSITPQQRKRLERAVAALNVLLAEVQRTIPSAGWYLNGTGNLCLMSGLSHGGCRDRPRPDRVLASAVLRDADGGDW